MINHFSVQASTFCRSLDITELDNNTDAPFRFRREKGMRFMDMKHMLMCDWDVPPQGGLVDEHFTVSSLEEVDTIMTNWVGKSPSQFWVGYKTPSGGAHAFLLSEKIMEIHHGVEILSLLKVDELYQYYCGKRGAFAVRVSPKPNRLGDYIASFWKTWGSGLALPELEEILRKHDSFLKPNSRYYK